MKITKEYLRQLIQESLAEVSAIEENDGEGMTSRQNIAIAKKSGANLQPGTILVPKNKEGEVILITGTVQGTNQSYPARAITFEKSMPTSFSGLDINKYNIYVTSNEKRQLFGLNPL